MKKRLRYIIALFMLGSMGIVFLPLVSLGDLRLSVANVVRMGFTKDGDLGFLQEVMEMAKSYIRNYSYMILVWLILIFAVAVLTALLPTGAAYIVSIIGQIAVNVIAIIFYVQIKDRITSVENALESVKGFFNFGGLPGVDGIGEIEVHILPVLFWIGIYLVTLSLAVWGALIKEEMTMWAGQTDILPESLKPGRNAYLSRIQELETSGRKLDMAGDMRNPIQNPGMPEAVEPRTMEKETVCLDFHGAITGEKGIYAAKTFLMEDRVPVYCCKEDRQMVVVPGRTGDLAAEIYYVTAYGEYCVKPHRRMTVFLESGQPLGEGREYYLPRGMRIYLENRDNSFVLE